MASWIKCTNEDGVQIRVNMDHAAVIRPYHRERGLSGNEIIFAAGNLSSIVVTEGEDYLLGASSAGRAYDQL